MRTVRVQLSSGSVIDTGVRPGGPGEVLLRPSAPEASSAGRAEASMTVSADVLPALREALDALDRERVE